MEKLKRINNILKITGTKKILLGFILFVLFTSFVIMLVEPSMNRYSDALWYSFCSFTTIGFGDFHAVTFIGRICTVFLGIYGILVVALIPGILVSYYMQFMNKKADETVGLFLEKLENLENLSQDELKNISKLVKERKYKN